ncbi:MAG: RICIN domain-containing protein, partial [Paludibacteraceae bacterium]|nr:RICIN domain-containing protein [Paludibacteraceae bacterium]
MLLLLISSITTCLHAVSTQTSYYIFHSSGMALSSVDGVPNLHTFDASQSQTFEFVQSGNYYLIRNKKTGTNVAKKETWNTEFTSSTGNVAKFSIESSGGDFVKFKCVDNNLYLGTDGTAPGSSVYSDKNGKETLHYWFLREANGNQLVTDGLQSIIAKAENRLASTIEGDKEGQFSSATRK